MTNNYDLCIHCEVRKFLISSAFISDGEYNNATNPPCDAYPYIQLVNFQGANEVSQNSYTPSGLALNHTLNGCDIAL